MKKIFFFAAALVAAMTINAETVVDQIRFTEAAAAGTLVDTVFSGENELIDFEIIDEKEKFTIDKNNAYFGTVEEHEQFTMRLRSNAKSEFVDGKHCQINVAAYEDGTLNIYVRTGSNSATDRNIIVAQGSDTLLNEVLLESNAIEYVVVKEEKDDTIKINPVYTIELKKGDYEITFPVGAINFYGFDFSADVQTAVEDLFAKKAKAQKIIENGQIFILKEGLKYNLLGTQVK